MAQNIGRSNKRLDGSDGAVLAAGNIALGVGWGDSAATVTITAGSNAQRGRISILTAGSNQAQATATIVLTFPDGAWPAAPFCLQKETTNDNSLTNHTAFTVTTTTTTATFTHTVLPVTGKNYVLDYAFSA